MKVTLTLALLLLLFLLPALPVYAYDPPEQSSDNATDIILWPGDDLTITGEVEITGFTDVANDYLAFLIVAFIIAIVLIKSSVILNALGVPVAVVYGFITASEQSVYSPLWVAGVAIGLLGLYFLYQIAADVVGRIARGRSE